MPNILFISDNEIFKTDILSQIEHQAPEFNILTDGADSADIIVVDENTKVLEDLLQKGLKAPLIFLSSAEGSDNSKVCNISKPFSLSLFLDNLKASINKFENSAEGVLEFNRYVLYPIRKEILNLRNNETTKLTEKEVSIIKYLYKNKDKIVGKQDLMQEVWGYVADVATHTVETHIYRLRQKVEHDNPSAQLILTSDGGYQLKF